MFDTMLMMKFLVCLWVVLFVACTKPNPEYCGADSDCMNPGKPFCDVNGEYPESGNTAHTCSVEPANCPAERCGCTPTAARCEGDDLVTCNADGRSETSATCAMGCSASDARCYTFIPSNGLSPALQMAPAESDVALPDGAKIDTTTGVVTTAGGTQVSVKSILVPQNGGPMIRAFIAKSFTIDNAVVFGTHAVAFVAEGNVTLRGLLNAGVAGNPGGTPGATMPPNMCTGAGAVQGANTPGGGGAGNGTAGGAGGGDHAPGGAAGMMSSGFTPLTGGCFGGDVTDINGALLGGSGRPGGAVQIVSATRIELTMNGVIHVGAGGATAGTGMGSGGGGSGGTVVLEAPQISLNGSSAGIAANGGGGAACGVGGANATPDLTPAPAGMTTVACAQNFCGGAGGTGAVAAKSACICTTCGSDARYGGGGGAVGRLLISTRDGTYESVGTPIVSAAKTTSMLVAK